MPLYKYQCTDKKCGLSFEALTPTSQRDEQKCTACGSEALREGLQAFNVSTPLDASRKIARTNKEIDQVIGADAAKKWEAFEKKTAKKLEGANVVNIPIKPGTVFNPEALIGDANRRSKAELCAEVMTSHKETELAEGRDPSAWDKTGFKKLSL